MITALLALLPAAASGDTRGPACALQVGPARAVTGVPAADTLRLDDGSELRLAGIVAPHPSDAATDTAFWPPAAAARAALETRTIGRSIEIGLIDRASDRYGRLIGHAFIVDNGRRTWLQAMQLDDGHARVHAHADRSGCLEELLGHERLAQAAGKGLWSNAAYGVRQASDTHTLMRYRHTLQLVEGRVAEVAEVRGRVYLNFGSDWRSDFTAGIERPRSGGWPAEIAALKGGIVRVRGFIERRNGPYVELTHPSQLEVLAEPATDTAPSRQTAAGRSRPRTRSGAPQDQLTSPRQP